jgi:putative ABC transport system substrate-binding protein
MRWREFIGFIGTTLAVPLVASAQHGLARAPRLAYLGVSGAKVLDPRYMEGFKQGLLENGLIEGDNVTVDYFWAEGDRTRLDQLAGEIGKGGYNVIVTAGPQAMYALTATQTTTPIVFAIVADPVGNRFVTSLARPGGNVTGLSMSNSDLESKRIEILKEGAPGITRIMALRDPTMGAGGLQEAAATATALQLEFEEVTVQADQFEAAFTDAVRRGANGITTFASPFFNFHRRPLIDLAARHRLPSIWEAATYVRDGGLLSYGPSFGDMYRRSAGYVARILKGAKPADLPVEQPIRFELSANLKTARELGITLPPTLIGRADEVIE